MCVCESIKGKTRALDLAKHFRFYALKYFSLNTGRFTPAHNIDYDRDIVLVYVYTYKCTCKRFV